MRAISRGHFSILWLADCRDYDDCRIPPISRRERQAGPARHGGFTDVDSDYRRQVPPRRAEILTLPCHFGRAIFAGFTEASLTAATYRSILRRSAIFY
jgi:hypothetical protein